MFFEKVENGPILFLILMRTFIFPKKFKVESNNAVLCPFLSHDRSVTIPVTSPGGTLRFKEMDAVIKHPKVF